MSHLLWNFPVSSSKWRFPMPITDCMNQSLRMVPWNLFFIDLFRWLWNKLKFKYQWFRENKAKPRWTQNWWTDWWSLSSVTAARPVLPCRSQKYPGINRQVKQSAEKTPGHIPRSTKGLNLILKANLTSKESRSRKIILPRNFSHWESGLSFHN